MRIFAEIFVIRSLYFFILVGLVAATFTGCVHGEDYSTLQGLTGFDVSADGNTIIYSFAEDSNSYIASVDRTGRNRRMILQGINGTAVIRPRYGHGDTSIVYVAYTLNDKFNSAIHTYNPYSGVRTVLIRRSIIQEAIFRPGHQEIIFAEADRYEKYSPIGVKAAHGYHIYSCSFDGKSVKQLTTNEAYAISNLNTINATDIIFRLHAGDNSGMFALAIDSPGTLRRIGPPNSEDAPSSLYYSPVYSNVSNDLYFMGGYRIFRMKRTDTMASVVYWGRGGSNLHEMVVDDNRRRIWFTKEHDSSILYSVGFDGEKLEQIALSH